jgi:hypothetical protein
MVGGTPAVNSKGGEPYVVPDELVATTSAQYSVLGVNPVKSTVTLRMPVPVSVPAPAVVFGPGPVGLTHHVEDSRPH